MSFEASINSILLNKGDTNTIFLRDSKIVRLCRFYVFSSHAQLKIATLENNVKENVLQENISFLFFISQEIITL